MNANETFAQHEAHDPVCCCDLQGCCIGANSDTAIRPRCSLHNVRLSLSALEDLAASICFRSTGEAAKIGEYISNDASTRDAEVAHGSIFCDLAYSVVASFHSLLIVFVVSVAAVHAKTLASACVDTFNMFVEQTHISF